ncbi:MAG: putative tryptophan/tyrosine transport system substrate-binding protein [Candidatus Dependentiae bacterium]|nr:putative tryptophan/tyrosine transport system substrate-binding protein [Candidatus Dependentiae bacterium]
MKKSSFLNLFLYCNALLLTIIIGNYYYEKVTPLAHNAKTLMVNNLDELILLNEGKKDPKEFTISLLVSSYSPIVEALVEEFQKSFSAATARPYTIRLYNAESNYMLLDAMVKKLLTSSDDLIWVVGIQALQVVANNILKHPPTSPIMVSSVPWSLLQELAEETPILNKYATGWAATCDWALRIGLMHAMLPHAKKAIVVHEAGRRLTQREEMLEQLKAHGIAVTEVVIVDVATAINYVRNNLDGIDVIIVTRECGFISMIDKFINLASNYHVPLCAYDMSSIVKGAACGLCSNETVFGRYSAWFAKKLLLEGVRPSELSFVDIRDWGIHAMINENALASQCPNFPENIKFLMGHSYVIKESLSTIERELSEL